jgi:TolA-binding protein
LEKAFKANSSLFVRDSSASRKWKDYTRDIAAWLTLTPRDLDIEYHTYPERYTRDSVRVPFAEARPALFDALKQTAYARLDAAVLETLKKRFKVRIEDPALKEPSLEPTGASYKKAQDLHYDRKLDQALSLYEKLRAGYPERAGLQDSVSFGIAQIYLEQERFAQALAEYRRVNHLYPKSPNDYKAMFMVGFIQSEHLRQDSAAVSSFEAMLKKHPNSDLSDDADWMIRNIRSGGKLMPALEDDSTSTESTPAN